MTPPTLTPLPIDPILPDLLRAMESKNAAVVIAEPGAGKTTRVPPALLSAPFAQGKQIWVLQPRRLAAKTAAMRVAEEMGESVGPEFDEVVNRLEKGQTPDQIEKDLPDLASAGDPPAALGGCEDIRRAL